MSSRSFHLAILGLLVAVVGAACARQAAPPTGAVPAASTANEAAAPPSTNGRIGGIVQQFDDGEVVLQGGTRFELNPDARLIRSVPTDPGSVEPGAFVAVTAKRQPDGKLLASVVNIFPESMRGLGEGQRPMDGGNLMTNATVGDVGPNLMTNATVDEAAGSEFSLLFPGGGDDVELADDAQVNQFEAASTEDLVPGTSITALVTDGSANFLTIM